MRSLRYLFIPVLAAIVCTCWCETARAQVPAGLAPTSPSAKPSLYATAPIQIDGTTVLHVTAPASPPPGALPIETRVFLINGAIAQLLAVDPDTKETIYDPKTFKIDVAQEGSEYALVATDERHRNPLPILTVTSVDARHANMPVAELAHEWQAGMQQMIVSALERRQPAVIHHNTTVIAYGAIALVLLTIVGLVAARFTHRRFSVAIPWTIVVVWLAAITYALTLFPATVTTGQQILHFERRLLVIWVAAFIIERLLAVAIHQTVRSLATFGVTHSQTGRSLLRAPTLSRALIGFERLIVYFIAVLLTLSALNVPIASVVTIGGIAALAIGFAAQSLVRDFLNGLLVLFEDQYVVGDYIMIGDFNGIVEYLTLRVVQLRDGDGNLITIPHSSVTQVVNASRNWSRVDYRVTVAPTADLHKAISIVRDTIEALQRDEAWRDAILDPVEWIGVETLAVGGTTIRCRMRTAPLRQFELRREINLRMSDAFKKAGIALGSETLPAAVAPAASPDPK
jgi:moderate conductance mechanosensitive channel